MKKLKISSCIIIFSILMLLNLGFSQDKSLKPIPKGQSLQVPKIYNPITLTSYIKTVIFEETFETGAPSWSLSGSWAVGTPTSGPKSGYNSSKCAATNLSGDYPNSANDWLISPDISLTSASPTSKFTLHFMEWFKTESGYDYGYVKISTDGGTNWTLLSARDGSSDWREFSIDITQYSNRRIKIAFHFISDGSITYPGWYVDNVQIIREDPKPISARMLNLNSQNFPFIYMNIAVDTFGVGFPGLTRSNFTVYENNVLQTDYFHVVPPDTGAGVRLTDIIFLMDNSGSMEDDITAVRNNLIAFVDNLVSSGINFALGLCRFGASQNGGYPIIEDNGILTTDANYFKNTVWARNRTDGSFEPGWDALYTSATSFNFRPGSQKIFILITDESVTGNGNRGVRSQEEVIQVLKSNNIITFALIDSTDSYARQDYGTIAQATGGQYFHIYRPFDEILNYIGRTVSNTYVVSYRSSNPNFDATTRHVKVIVNYRGNSDTTTGTYIPGSSPIIQRTSATIALHNKPWAEGTTFNIDADIVDNIAPYVQSARLYYRRTGDATYSSVAMTLLSGTTYRGVIPGTAVRTPGLDYYITATDGITTSSDPRIDPANNPYQLAILPNVAPVIKHTPVTTLTPGVPITIRANIVDSTNYLATAKLFYRKTGQLLYQQVTMTNIGGNDYQAVIPASYVTAEGIDYYIYAVDNFGVSSTYGTPDLPITLKNPMAYIAEKEAIISYFQSENFYLNAEQQAQQYINEIKSKINSNTHTNKDIEGVRRLALVEEAAKVAYPRAKEIARLSAKTTMQLAADIVLEFIFSELLKALEPVKNWLGIKHIYKGTGELVDNFKKFRNSIRLQATTQIGYRTSSILQKIFNLSQPTAQRVGMQLANKIFKEAEDEIVDKIERLIQSWKGFTAVENLINYQYLKIYGEGLQVYLSIIDSFIVFNIGNTEKAIVLSISDARDGKFTEGNINVVTQTILQSKLPQITSETTHTVQSINSKINFAELIDKLSLITIIISGVVAVIVGIISCPVGGIGCIISAIGSLSIWGLVSLLLSFFNATNTAVYTWATGEGLYHLYFSIPDKIKDIKNEAFDLSTSSLKNKFNFTTYHKNLRPIPLNWTDSLLSISNLTAQNFMAIKTFIHNDQWAEAEKTFDSLRFYLRKMDINQNILIDILNASYIYNAYRRVESDSLLYYTSAYSSASDISVGFSQFALGYALAVKPTGMVKDSILALVDSCILRIQSIAPKYRQTFELFNNWGFQTPPLVSILDAKITKDNSKYLLVTRIKNISNTNVSNVVASVRSYTDENLRIKPLTDTTVNTLNSLEEREFKWEIQYLGKEKILMLEIDIYPSVLPGDFQSTRRVITEIMDVDKSPPTTGPLANENVYAYPNPFNPDVEHVKLRFKLGKDGSVTITIFDISNTKVKEVISAVPMSAGVEQSIVWDGRNERDEIVANGVYFYVIESSSGERAVGKVVVLR